jgi:hypothetical protein
MGLFSSLFSSKQTNKSEVDVDPNYQRFLDENLDAARGAFDGFTAFQGGADRRVANFSQDQVNAFDLVRGAANDPNSIGRQAETQGLSRFLSPPSTQDYNAFVNPYLDQVLDRTNRRSVEEHDRQISDLRRRSGNEGAYGGSRFAVQEAVMSDNLLDRLADSNAQVSFDAFERGSNRLFDTGAQAVNLGQQSQNQDFTRANALLGSGDRQQQLEQFRRDFDFDEFLRSENTGRQDALSLSEVGARYPTSLFDRTETQTSTPGLFGTIAGLGLSAFGLPGFADGGPVEKQRNSFGENLLGLLMHGNKDFNFKERDHDRTLGDNLFNLIFHGDYKGSRGTDERPYLNTDKDFEKAEAQNLAEGGLVIGQEKIKQKGVVPRFFDEKAEDFQRGLDFLVMDPLSDRAQTFKKNFSGLPEEMERLFGQGQKPLNSNDLTSFFGNLPSSGRDLPVDNSGQVSEGPNFNLREFLDGASQPKNQTRSSPVGFTGSDPRVKPSRSLFEEVALGRIQENEKAQEERPAEKKDWMSTWLDRPITKLGLSLLGGTNSDLGRTANTLLEGRKAELDQQQQLAQLEKQQNLRQEQEAEKRAYEKEIQRLRLQDSAADRASRERQSSLDREAQLEVAGLRGSGGSRLDPTSKLMSDRLLNLEKQINDFEKISIESIDPSSKKEAQSKVNELKGMRNVLLSQLQVLTGQDLGATQGTTETSSSNDPAGIRHLIK